MITRIQSIKVPLARWFELSALIPTEIYYLILIIFILSFNPINIQLTKITTYWSPVCRSRQRPLKTIWLSWPYAWLPWPYGITVCPSQTQVTVIWAAVVDR